MIADWTVDVGPDSPVIAVPWPGHVDLHWPRRIGAEFHEFKQADRLEEVRQFPELRPVLRMANACCTLTSKVDVYSIQRTEVDPEIVEGWSESDTMFGLGSYLDCYTEKLDHFSGFAQFERVSRATAAYLGRNKPVPAGAEIVLRPARLYDEDTFAWTLYTFAFGRSEQAARSRWSLASLQTVWAFQLAFASELYEIRKAQAIATGE